MNPAGNQKHLNVVRARGAAAGTPGGSDAHLGCIDQLIGQTLCNRLDVPERSFSCSRAQQPDGLKKPEGWVKAGASGAPP